MGIKVCKFGGSSLADSKAIENVANIVLSDPERRFVVVSAPGKRNKADTKVTDMLYSCCDEMGATGSCDNAFGFIETRFKEIVKELNLNVDIEKHLEIVKNKITADDRFYAASRGEYLNGVVVAAKLGFEFVDASDIIKFKEDGSFDSEYTNDIIQSMVKPLKNAVIPGFYGSAPDGTIKTFSRGGSDVTGAIIARGVDSEVYENWTDVDGFLCADPSIVNKPQLIDILSYRELRELSYMGASVLHSDAVFPVRSNNIPINIKNTFNPSHKGTLIIPAEDYVKSEKIVTGIAGKKDFTVIYVEKQMMNSELGFCRKVLSVLEHRGISVEHIPTGIDTMCLIIRDSELKGNLDKVLTEIAAAVNADNIKVSKDLALIALVGHGMQSRKGTTGRMGTALGNAGINIKMMDQGSSELNIIIGVDNADYEKAINAIYNEFFN